MKRNFLNILFSVCSSTKAFNEVVKFSIFRSLWHLIVLSILCSLLFVVIRTPEMKNNIEKVNSFLVKEFGSVNVEKDGVYPQIDKDKARDLSYDLVGISYYPKLPDEKDFNLKDKLNNVGFIWLPDGITGWLKMGENKFIVYQGLASNTKPQFFTITDEKGVYYYLESNKLTSFDNLYTCLCAPLSGDIPLFMLLAPVKSGINSFSDFAGDIYWYSSGMAAVKFVIMIIFNALFYSLLFALFFSISGRGNPTREFTFKSAFNTAVYAGFPAAIIGTLFTIAKFPWFEYQTIYLLAMFIYLIVITQKKRNKPKLNDL